MPLAYRGSFRGGQSSPAPLVGVYAKSVAVLPHIRCPRRVAVSALSRGLGLALALSDGVRGRGKFLRASRRIPMWCEAHEYVDRNVAGECIDGALHRQRDKPEHHRSLPFDEVPKFVCDLESWPAAVTTKLGLLFTILTATRGIEAREARWEEIDEEQAMWSIPGSRMKMGKDHDQPLSEAALAVLARARPLGNGSGFVFPSPTKPGSALSNMAFMMLMRRMGYAERATVHGFRASFRTWASERTRATERVKKLSTAHAPGDKIDAAYDRSLVLDPRRELMERWGCHVTGHAFSGPELGDPALSGVALPRLLELLLPGVSDR